MQLNSFPNYSDIRGRGFVGLQHRYILQGREIPDERFGTSIAHIGDIDNDGFCDIAVGAPGGDKGSVYIFNMVPSSGVMKKYSQVISASDIPNSAPGMVRVEHIYGLIML